MPDKMLRVAGRGDDGTAKALQTNSDGDLRAFISGSKHETVVEQHELRSTTLLGIFRHQAYDGVIEQSIILDNSLDVAVKFSIAVNMGPQSVPNSYLYGPVFYSHTVPPGGRLFLIPDKSHHINTEVGNNRTVDVPELRMPIPVFRIELTPQDTPTTGNVNIMYIRRF